MTLFSNTSFTSEWTWRKTFKKWHYSCYLVILGKTVEKETAWMMTFCPEQSQARLYTKRPEKKASRRSGEACGKLFTVSHISFRWKLVWNSANLACVYIFSLKMPFWWEYALGRPDFFRLSCRHDIVHSVWKSQKKFTF